MLVSTYYALEDDEVLEHDEVLENDEPIGTSAPPRRTWSGRDPVVGCGARAGAAHSHA
jgi:hypothetical protein